LRQRREKFSSICIVTNSISIIPFVIGRNLFNDLQVRIFILFVLCFRFRHFQCGPTSSVMYGIFPCSTKNLTTSYFTSLAYLVKLCNQLLLTFCIAKYTHISDQLSSTPQHHSLNQMFNSTHV
jgi:hypothetical protein